MAQDAGRREPEVVSGDAAGTATRVGHPGAEAAPRAEAGRAAPHEAQDDDAATAPALGRNPEVEESALPPHEPGSMDISQHEETYQTFIRLTIRGVIAIFALLILLALVNG